MPQKVKRVPSTSVEIPRQRKFLGNDFGYCIDASDKRRLRIDNSNSFWFLDFSVQ